MGYAGLRNPLYPAKLPSHFYNLQSRGRHIAWIHCFLIHAGLCGGLSQALSGSDVWWKADVSIFQSARMDMDHYRPRSLQGGDQLRLLPSYGVFRVLMTGTHGDDSVRVRNGMCDQM